ncbi:GNAT family N-acetyltransferase [Jeotgalibaca sp. MA1X17-3]|uniref:GNAT family N-acetyltransferase n=1 Tax=Jeotgalibaca sp. MA1X17-3 TaxID=2908211 RepID=UPI001F25E1EB|nr:GNAT family protein [Jeotgalibaca sp. MA1X17-3]UJF15268.1 GNAT family N-acetyltransferase [Jeotgalibaca sp. MA1X17-3]
MIEIRQFKKEDIPYKIEWVNNKENNKYLHYDLPLREDKTIIWFDTIKNRKDRIDYTITYEGEPVGLIGLLNIDYINEKAEYYILLGNYKFKRMGISKKASKLLIEESYKKFKLKEVYLYTEAENKIAQKLFESIGFLKKDLTADGIKEEIFMYILLIEEYFNRENKKG